MGLLMGGDAENRACLWRSYRCKMHIDGQWMVPWKRVQRRLWLRTILTKGGSDAWW